MTLHSNLIKLTLVSLILLSILFVPFVSPSDHSVYAESLEEQLDRIERELASIRNLQQTLNSSISSEQARQGQYYGVIGGLRGEVEMLQLEISELDLQIQELNVNISVIEKQISDKESELLENQEYVETLETETSGRIEQGYKEFRTHRQNRVDIFNVTDPNTYFKDSQYRELLQAKTNMIMQELNELKLRLNRDREELKEKQVTVRRDRAIVAETQTQFNRMENELQSKIDGYYSAIYTSQSSVASAYSAIEAYSEEESRKMAEAERIRQEIFNSFGSIPNGQYVLRGTQIGNQGSTGWSTGPHVHFIVKQNGQYRNPCDLLAPMTFIHNYTGSGCGWGSGLDWPLKGSYYYTSPFGMRSFGGYAPHFHDGLDIAHPIWNAPVYAAHDGWLQKGIDQYGGLYIIICEDRHNCNNGLMTGYWHFSSY